jgi:DNA-binding MarR family transcriptional regulator
MSSNRSFAIHHITDHLLQFGRVVRSGCCVPFQATHLRRRQLQILLFLARARQPISSKILADKMQVTTGAITQLVDELEAQKLVERQSVSTDRRVVEIVLSDTAKQHLQAFRTAQHAAVEPLFTDLTSVELETLSNLITKIALPQRGCEKAQK